MGWGWEFTARQVVTEGDNYLVQLIP